MHHHEYYITMLKTPYGYLTKKGFANDINDKNIILLPSNSYGYWSSTERRIEYFIKCYEGEEKEAVTQKLLDCVKEIETKTYHCPSRNTYCCYFRECERKKICQFWKDRSTLELYRLY